MNNSEIDALVLKEVRNLLKAVSALNAQELRSLPPENVEEIQVGGKSLVLCTYRDVLPTKEHLLIVQCKNNRYFGYGKMMAEGIVVEETGKKRPAEEELMWEYV